MLAPSKISAQIHLYVLRRTVRVSGVLCKLMTVKGPSTRASAWLQYTPLPTCWGEQPLHTCIPVRLTYSWVHPQRSVSSSVLHLHLCRPDRGVDAHVVRSCWSLHGRGKARGDEGQPSRFTSPSGTASQHPAGDRRCLLTSAGESTEKYLPNHPWVNLACLYEPKVFYMVYLEIYIHMCVYCYRHWRKLLVEAIMWCDSGLGLSFFAVSWHIWTLWAAAVPTLIQPVYQLHFQGAQNHKISSLNSVPL